MKQTFAATAAIRRLIIERKENVSKVNAAAIHPVKSTAVMIGPPARPAACSMQHQLRNSPAGSKRRARRHVRVKPGVGPVHREVLRLRAAYGRSAEGASQRCPATAETSRTRHVALPTTEAAR